MNPATDGPKATAADLPLPSCSHLFRSWTTTADMPGRTRRFPWRSWIFRPPEPVECGKDNGLRAVCTADEAICCPTTGEPARDCSGHRTCCSLRTPAFGHCPIRRRIPLAIPAFFPMQRPLLRPAPPPDSHSPNAANHFRLLRFLPLLGVIHPDKPGLSPCACRSPR